MPPGLADGAGSPVDQGVSTFLFIGAVLFGIVAAARLRGRAFTGLPVAVGWLSAGATVACPGCKQHLTVPAGSKVGEGSETIAITKPTAEGGEATA